LEKSLKIKSLSLLFLCALCWGPSYLFIKIAVPEIPPLTLVLGRVAIAAFLLYLFCRFQNYKILDWKHLWKQFIVMGITLNALPFYLISFGELYIPSSLAGILNSFTLIFTSLFAHFFGTHDPLTKNKIVGICAGVLGLGIIYLPILFHENIENGVGAFMIILACLSYGGGTVYARSHLHKLPGIVVLTAQLIIATAILLPLSLYIDRPFHLPFPSYQAILGVMGLGVIGTAAGFLLYYKAIQLAGATYAALTVLLVPIFAMIFGALFLNEQLTWNLYLGTFFILAGVVAVNPAFNKK
jgi:drug/metabolite transporter (DMT)-like permease